MPAIVLIGAQWGDEGKGKVTDILGGQVAVRRALPGRQQRRSHGRLARRPELRAAPDPIRHPHPGSPRHRQRRGRRPRCAPGGARRALTSRGRGHLQAADQRRRPPDHAVPRGDGQGHRAVPRQGQDRHDRPRDRSGVPGQGGRASGVRVPDLLDENDPAPEGRSGAAPEEPGAGEGLQPARAGRRGRGGRVLAHGRRFADRDRRHPPAAQPGPRPRRDRAARGRAGHAAGRRPRHLPVRHLLEPDGGRRSRGLRHRADPDRPGDRHRSRRTPPASAPGRSPPSCATRWASTCARSAARSG